MKISILGGAGLMGAGIARDLVSDRAIVDIASIRICDTSRQRMENLVADLGDPRLELFDLNVTDPARLAEAIEGADLCINCVPTLLGFQMTIFEAALSARVAYMDLGGLGTFTVKQIAEHERFQGGRRYRRRRGRRRSRHVQCHLPRGGRRTRHDREDQPLLGGRTDRR
ncbi:saccharopine dehydrogenase NADP-binding domain-containing protein [Rhizobium sp. RCAM05350]|nr:saccharopine dehydrogenase NADP-binding domain-containing protein [Rhizobium sp. RCAM05350]